MKWWIGVLMMVVAAGGAWAQQAPGTSEIDLCSRQLGFLHNQCDALERRERMELESLAGEAKKWQDYYRACRPADRWLCDEPK